MIPKNSSHLIYFVHSASLKFVNAWINLSLSAQVNRSHITHEIWLPYTTATFLLFYFSHSKHSSMLKRSKKNDNKNKIFNDKNKNAQIRRVWRVDQPNIHICIMYIERLFIILGIEQKKKNTKMKRNERKTDQRDIFNIWFGTNIQRKTIKHCPTVLLYIHNWRQCHFSCLIRSYALIEWRTN